MSVLKSEGLSTASGILPSWSGNLHQEEEPPQHLAVKVSRALLQESQQAIGN